MRGVLITNGFFWSTKFDELADIYNNKSLKDKVAQAKAEYMNESLQNLSNSDLNKCEKDS